MKNIFKALFFLPVIAYAGVDSGAREIVDIGCHRFDNTCFVTISGDAVGPSECSHYSVRWNVEKSANGNAALSQITAAYFAGKKVNFRISESCYSEQTNFPTFDWWYIK